MTSAIAILVVGVAYIVVYVLKFNHEKLQASKRFDVDFVNATIEEAICHVENKFKLMKRETAHNAGMTVRKMSPEVIKNPIEVEKILNAAMEPVRNMCLKAASDYVDERLKGSNYAKIMPIINQAIKMRIDAAKLQINDPLRALIYGGLHGK